MDNCPVGLVPGDGTGGGYDGARARDAASACDVRGALQSSSHHYPWGCDYSLQEDEMTSPGGTGMARTCPMVEAIRGQMIKLGDQC